MALAILIGVAVGLLYDPENITSARWSETFAPLVLFFLAVILFPLLEETLFRLSLKFSPIFLSLTSGIMGYNIITKAIYHTNLSNINEHFEIRVMVGLSIILILYPLFSVSKIKKNLEIIWKTNFKWILYFFCITFAWVHIFNYELTLEHLLLMPLITLPKLISALCYGYIRINYGFVYSLGLHMCTNSIGFIMSMLPAIQSD